MMQFMVPEYIGTFVCVCLFAAPTPQSPSPAGNDDLQTMSQSLPVGNSPKKHREEVGGSAFVHSAALHHLLFLLTVDWCTTFVKVVVKWAGSLVSFVSVRILHSIIGHNPCMPMFSVPLKALASCCSADL